MTELDTQWDVIVVGGGITGAGLFRQAVHQGYKTLLVEQKDFAWGTSSRSSKLVHGGLRYLKEGRLKLVRDSVRERQRLLEEAPGLVEPLAFLVPDFRGQYPPRPLFQAGLAAYDTLGGSWQHRWLDRNAFLMAAPHLRREGLQGGARFVDAQVDDARLVLRVIFEGIAEGGTALNYTTARLPHREKERTRVTLVRDGQSHDVEARVVLSATGAWADRFLERHPGRLRPLRGSHVVFPAWRLPLPCALSFNHPADGRPCFVIPWEGASFCGTTDLDHRQDLDAEPCISGAEVSYLLEGLAFAMPHLQLAEADILGSWAGVRPVISTNRQADPSKETRDHGLWVEDGVVTITGGKLTTFRLMAREALEAAAVYLDPPHRRDLFTFKPPAAPTEPGLGEGRRRRLGGRYGSRAGEVWREAPASDLEEVPGSLTLWAELTWAAAQERVHHLDDLLLRRTRLGFVLPQGGAEHLPRIRTLTQSVLGWDDARWESEEHSYLKLWERAYAPSPSGFSQDVAQRENSR